MGVDVNVSTGVVINSNVDAFIVLGTDEILTSSTNIVSSINALLSIGIVGALLSVVTDYLERVVAPWNQKLD